jgi:outer membrane protein OmpA-like peptidoglycan-associated protein
MKNLKYVIAILFSLNTLYSSAQIQAKFDLAKSAYKILAYTDAIKYLNEYLAKKEDIDAEIMLADCYRRTNQYSKAEDLYRKTTYNTYLKDKKQLLYYAQVLQVNKKYSEAAKMYNEYLITYPKDVRANNQLTASKNISKYQGDSLDYLIYNLPFNTDGYDFGTCINKNKFYYTSTGSKEQKNVKTDKFLNEPFMNIYEAQMIDSNNLNANATVLNTGINTKYHEGPICFWPFSNTVFFTRNDYNPDKKGIRKIGFDDNKIINLKIYQSTINDNIWSNTTELPFNSKDYSCGHPTIDTKNKIMYFTSDMPGGYGGTDIWMSKFDGKTWETPINMGSKINTEGNEMFPFFHAYRVLYFSSDGLPGLGGLDIFSADISDNNTPSNITNVGSSLNSSKDDFGFLISDDLVKGYLSSNRDGGKGDDDIYKFVNNRFELEGIVVNKFTQKAIINATVDEIINSKKIKNFITNKEGFFFDTVRGKQTYTFTATAENYQKNTTEIYIEPVESKHKYYVKIELAPIVGEILVINELTKMPIENANISINSNCLENTLELSTTSIGKTYFDIKNKCDYNLLANAKGYLPNVSKIATLNVIDTLHHVIELSPINNKPIVLNNIYYDFDKSYIRQDAVPDLNMLLTFMKNNTDAIIELSSYTDARGIDDYNQVLSQHRAESAVNWLVAKGINKDKIMAVGYGESKPINNCINDIICSEENHQRNRRTEFKVLNAGEVTVSQDKSNMRVDKCKNCPF